MQGADSLGRKTGMPQRILLKADGTEEPFRDGEIRAQDDAFQRGLAGDQPSLHGAREDADLEIEVLMLHCSFDRLSDKLPNQRLVDQAATRFAARTRSVRTAMGNEN